MIETRRVFTKQQDVISEDGEVLATNEVHVDVVVKNDKDFFFTFSDHLHTILNLDGNEMKVLLWCSMNCQLNTNEIALPKGIKERMMSYIGLKRSSVDNALTKLVKKGLMKRICQGVYFVNPDATWRGKVTNQPKQMKVFLNYSIEE